ncbi:type II toxin-antitoxin system HigB family toxin [Scytonema hofmannii]|uniref:type II toxin-antitoxin system HigB family toxin n=1 Tax=Scytonema hofmannii TaxID=34078 RepID=UPI0003455DA3
MWLKYAAFQRGDRTYSHKYRLIVDIIYPEATIFIKYVLTHAEYDKDKWTNDPYY